MYLITKWFGVFLSEKNKIVKEILFPQDENEIVKKLLEINYNNILPEEEILAKKYNVIVCEKRLQPLGEYREFDPYYKKISIIAEDYGFSKILFHEVSVQLARIELDEQLHSKDLQIIQMVNALDDLIQTANLLSERLHHWGIIPTPKEKIQPFQNTLLCVNEEINRLERQIDSDMKIVAPNISKIAGSLIGARLLSHAGRMRKLALFPSSTVQILGAEKALFRFKKEGGKPPKHGIIFQHYLVNKAPKSERGKIARILAAKIATAAKADAFTRRDIADDLSEELSRRIKEMKNK
jgi:nucleolar protein 56